ncbi:hypothetical protein KY284_033814 [Solanum tuberosum]|nr:hypothetical protein KY284_033814 [Solanum tuberosum]
MGDNKNDESTSNVNNTSSLTSSLMTRIVSNAKFAVEIFDGSGHFGMWQGEVLDVLFQQGLDIAIEEKKPDGVGEEDWKIINRVACDLRNMDVTFTDGDMALMLLSSLPDEFEHLETTLLHGNDELQQIHPNHLMYSACSYHMCPNRDWFVDLQKGEYGVIHTANNNPLTAYGVGSIRLRNHDRLTRTLIDVRYVPNLKKNLIFVGSLESKGFKVIADNGIMRICSGALVVMKAIRRINNMYHYQGSTVIGTAATTSNNDKKAEMTRLWHMHLGHAGGKSLKTLSDQGVLKGVKTCNLEFCEHCVKGKQTRAMIETQSGKKIKCLRTNNGGEYKNDLFQKNCEENGIVRHFTVRNTPQQNGVAERMNRTLLEKVRCMLSNAGLGKEFWAEAITYACHLINRLPSAAIGGKTPLEKRDVTFDESALTNKVTVEEVKQTDGASKQVEFEGKIIFPTHGSNEKTTKVFPLEEELVEGEVPSQEPQPQLESITTSKPKRTIRKPARLIYMVACADSIAADDIPTTYKDAVQSSEEDKWRFAMDEEIQSLHQNHTWKLANLPDGKKAIGCKWVFAKKEGFPNQEYVCYKARLVAK